MNVLLMVVSILFAFLNACFLHKMKEQNLQMDMLLFNALISVVWLFIFFLYALYNRVYCGQHTVFYGVLYGTVMAGYLLFKSRALISGSMALTTMVGCSSFVITTILNVMIWHEKITVSRVLCIGLMLVAIIMILIPQNEEEKIGFSKRWFWDCIVFFVMNSSVGIVFRFQQFYDKEGTDLMFIIASATAAILLFLISFFQNQKILVKTFSKIRNAEKSIFKYIFICGITGSIYNRLNIYLRGVMENAVFFPIFNGAVVLLTALGGMIIFKEKMPVRQKRGIILGCIAIAGISLA